MIITNKLLIDWIQHLESKWYANSTIERYFTDIKLFIEYLKNKIGVSTVSSDDITLLIIDQWKIILSQTLTPCNSIYYTIKPTISDSTIQWKITAIKSLLKYLNYYYDEWLDYRKLEIKKCKSDYIESLTDDEFHRFMNFIGDYEKYRINALRSQLLVNIGYTSWMRLSEMLSLNIKQIQNKETKIKWKWNKIRWVFFTPSTLEILDNYLREREKPIPRTGKTENHSDYVFISHNSGYDFWTPIKKNTVCEKIKKYSDEIKLGKRITVHSLRHSYATKLLENWLNIREIQELLWHKDIQTTETYCHVLHSSLKNKVSAVFT